MRYRYRNLWVFAILLIVAILLTSTWIAGAEEGGAHLGNIGADDLVVETLYITPSADTVLHAWYPNNNYGREWTLSFRSGSITSPMLKFDLSALPVLDDLLVAQAKVYFYVQSRSNPVSMSVSAYAVKTPWVEDEATWLLAEGSTMWQEGGCNGPNDREQQSSEAVLFSDVGRWVSLDVTEIVQSWVAGGVANHGIVLKSSAGGSVAYSVIGADHADVSLRPMLEIVLVAIPTPEATMTPTSTPRPKPGVSIQKTGPEGPLTVGETETISYTIGIRKIGVEPVSSVVITDALPLGTGFLNCTGGGVYDAENSVVVWRIPSLGVGITEVVKLNLILPTWVKEEGAVVNLVRADCAECSQVQEDIWEIPVLVPEPTLTPIPYEIFCPIFYNSLLR